jgi:hypothetical protein
MNATLPTAVVNDPIETGAQTPDRRKRQLICPLCRSDGVRRVKPRMGIVTYFLEFRGKKRFICCACDFIFYSFARRREDSL